MKQKIYSDRTELEGVELPSAGQTRMLVIDENKKIKSEAKPTIPTKTSELENDSGFITSSYLDITLDKSDINNLHTTPITITSTDLGLGVGEGAKFLKELLEVRIFTDGTDFSSTRPIQIGNGELNDIMSLDNSLYASSLPDGTYAGGGMPYFPDTYKVKDEYYITVEEPITGGGTECYIKFRIFYQKINL